MEWSRELPTEEGWYWVRSPKSKTKEIVYVNEIGMVQELGYGEADHISIYENAEFQPVLPPQGE